MSTVPAPKSAADMIVAYFKDFNVLRETRMEYWGIQIINILDCIAYFAIITAAREFLNADLGMNDDQAGWVYALFTGATTLMLFVSGTVTDWLGIRKSTTVSMIGLMVLRLAMLGVGLLPSLPHRGLLAAILFLLMAPFMASVQTIFQAATQRYTTKRARSAGFNLWYLCMNIGALVGALAIDFVRLELGLSTVHIFTMGVGTAILCLIVNLLMVHREDQLVGVGEAPEPSEIKDGARRKTPLQIAAAVVREPALWRLMVLIALILGVRAVFTYLYLLMPAYWLRTIGPNAAYGTLNAINPFGIIIGLIVFIPIANKFKVFNMLVFGALISAFALFPMAVPWDLYFGLEIGPAHYLMAVLSMAIVTLGEIIWSPKLNEYTAAIAPKGQEGTYLGMSMIPWFFAKTIVSVFSGKLLGRWSPETVTVDGITMPLQQAMVEGRLDYWHRPEAMWLVLALWALVGCIGAMILRRWLTQGVREHPVAPGPA
jgi:dipeptide/tripeptide permease